ncbi:type II secretion system protein GspM [Janthinobacterium psychrotolerans]|uniref:MSHA biogenesis protein MshJ n=1 Tax=Janthinobacterium psychrotolerans TaxID=1747903 RepID=A0A1A7C1R4_9BURK|nr:type II secretion system protein GspM [Janthinobacterium psychrotolerans]OBV38258.1 MSHA biogenesis protein MshJ [Janthinobacterium psychrotolerans]
MKDQSLKQGWHKLAARLDALTLRERVMGFGAGAALLIFLLFSLLLNPLFAKQKMLNETIARQQQTMATIDAEILLKIRGNSVDPDAQERHSLERLRQEMTGLGTTLRTAQSGLVAPDRIVFLLERLLRQHARLRVESLRTLPSAPAGTAAAAAPVAGAVPPAPGAATPAASLIKTSPLLYRHGVEVVLRGSYIDMVNYMEALEAMPTRVFWGDARLEVEQYPDASLRLTLFTLSLDDKWISL